MIYNETKLKVLDNSGALIVKCFKIYGHKFGKIGDKIIVSVQTYRPGKRVKKGEVYKGIIVQTKSSFKRETGNFLKFLDNGVVLWKRKEDSPVGTRIRFVVPLELRFRGYLKIVLLASGTF